MTGWRRYLLAIWLRNAAGAVTTAALLYGLAELM